MESCDLPDCETAEFTTAVERLGARVLATASLALDSVLGCNLERMHTPPPRSLSWDRVCRTDWRNWHRCR